MTTNIRHNIMDKIKKTLLTLLLLLPLGVMAQFSQDKSDYAYMFKGELGYMPFVSNMGEEGSHGYYISDLRHIAGLNLINGVNIRQDFFAGIGLGYGYVARPQDLATGWHSALAFVDLDYRPLDVEFAPMVSAKLGASYMMADIPYGNTLTPYVELSAGLNWFYRYQYRNMERNYLSLYFELGFAYTQQCAFLPLRIGVRF